MITISGYSDDIVEVDGDLIEEFAYFGDPALIACSDGTLLRIDLDTEGVWRLTQVAGGSASYQHTPGTEDGTDRVVLDGDIRWVVYATEDDERIVHVLRKPQPVRRSKTPPLVGSQETTTETDGAA